MRVSRLWPTVKCNPSAADVTPVGTGKHESDWAGLRISPGLR